MLHVRKTTIQYYHCSSKDRFIRSLFKKINTSVISRLPSVTESMCFTLGLFLISFTEISMAAQTAADLSQTLNQAGNAGMNSTFSTLIAVAFFLILPVLGMMYFYNTLVNKEEEVFSAWAQVESNYQRRADLIPNLVKTVSAYMEHESSTLQAVTEARKQDQEKVQLLVSQLNSATLDVEKYADIDNEQLHSEAALQAFDDAQVRLGSLMGRLLATVEAYPNIKASDQMMSLQSQLEGTENRINISRINFNNKVETFNSAIRMIPGSLFASMGNFQRKAYFQADGNARRAVDVDYK